MINHDDKSIKQLIILGNGFDLACGLKSSYFDFFEFRFRKIAGPNTIKEYYEKNILNQNFNDLESKLKKITFWDIVFISEYYNSKLNRNSEWSDIESTIYEVLHYIATEDETVNLSDCSKEFLNTIKKSRYDYSDFIFSELIKFENCFNNYIFDQVINNNDYLNVFVPQKLSTLIKDDVIKSKHKNLSVFSFNYTLTSQNINNLRVHPAELFLLSDANDFSTSLVDITNSWINIHGAASNNIHHENPIIFGIDSDMVNKIGDSLPEYKLETRFTKTFRIAINNFFHTINSLPRDIDLITFYGHSLSPADFSYFESIFDMYNIYDSKVKLEFYYGTYNFLSERIRESVQKNYHSDIYLGNYINKKNDRNRQKLMMSIYQLFQSYGSTLRNNHGSNLLHRLLLEGRIAFIEDNGSFKLK